jgi:alpha-L-arabinofuranosidase
VVDEHYYEKPDWFLQNKNRYDEYNRSKSKVYVGEYASRGNTLLNALSEAVYMTALERNGDIVQMASYAPLLANTNHISWTPDLIYFNNTTVAPTINYYVQQLFSVNQGNRYFTDIISFGSNKGKQDSTLAASCTKENSTGDLILKIVNAGATNAVAMADLSKLGTFSTRAKLDILCGNPEQVNRIGLTTALQPVVSTINIQKNFSYKVPAYSLSVIRIPGHRK